MQFLHHYCKFLPSSDSLSTRLFCETIIIKWRWVDFCFHTNKEFLVRWLICGGYMFILYTIGNSLLSARNQTIFMWNSAALTTFKILLEHLNVFRFPSGNQRKSDKDQWVQAEMCRIDSNKAQILIHQNSVLVQEN